MTPETDLQKMLASLQPQLMPGEYVFCCLPAPQFMALPFGDVLASFREQEGITAVIPRELADARELCYDGVFAGITLAVYSSLEAVGLTAAVARALAECDVPANVVAACHHDHVFVPADAVDTALAALVQLSDSATS